MPNGIDPSALSAANNGQIVTFLHLSDLHVGMSSEGWLWPAIRSAFYTDLERLLPMSSLPDVVVFSGDLVQSAAPEEYDRLTEILGGLWDQFRKLGCNPIFFPVPGNHDFRRQLKGDLGTRALRAWWLDPEVPKNFWADEPGYREIVARSFENYQRFHTALSSSSVPMATEIKHGVIAGDIAARVPIRGQTVGLVGLNSAWLQVGDGDFKGLLDVDPRQLLAVVGDDPDFWCRQNAANLLVTHHPEAWLHPDSQATWRSEIYCGTRFDCHLFGHMHEQQSSVVSDGGYEGRRLLQGASLFGLEWIGERQSQRIHGYSLAQIQYQHLTRRLRQWPRIDVMGANGTRKLAPNYKYNLNDLQCFDFEYSADAAMPPISLPPPSMAVRGDRKVLEALRRILPSSEPARHVRKIDQQLCLDALLTKRMVWIVADWGLGADEFLDSLVARMEPARQRVFQFDFGPYHDRDEMLDGIKRDFGSSFLQICDSISQEPDCIVVFDDVETANENGGANASFIDALDSIAEAVLQYCPNARLVIRSRRRPVQTSIDVVELTALNDLDVMLYIQHHSAGGTDLATESFVRKIVGHTDGMPSRIDEALRDVELLGLDGLHLVDSDVSGKAAGLQPPPPGLSETIARLEHDGDLTSLRAFRLLSVLSLFPRGEYFESVRRFNATKPFYPRDAHRLTELGLVDTTEIPNVAASSPRTDAKSLVAKRLVREYLTGHLSTETGEKLNRQALNLYFGDQWTSGAIKPPKGMRFDERTCESWKIDNATLLIMREAKGAIEAGAEIRIANAATLADSYCTALHNGDHYGSLIRAAREFLAIYREVEIQESRRSSIEALLGRALRMSGYYEESISILSKAIEGNLPNSVKSRVLIALTLASESLGKTDDALKYGRACIGLDRHSGDALQARSVILGIESAGHPKRRERLLRLAREADRRGVHTIASNIRLLCMNEAKTEDEKLGFARQVLEDASINGDDQYNAMRAMLRICEISVSKGVRLSDSDLARVIDAYHYLLNESMDWLFGLAHRVLWKHFVLAGDAANLLSLFRHSSFKWHLRGKSAEDRKYSAEAVGFLENKLRDGFIRSTREIAYLVLRSGQSLKLLN